MKATLLLGGSGSWNLILNGKYVAGGHIPRNAPFDEVLRRQLRRIATAAPGSDSYRALRGGGVREIDIHDDLAEALLFRYEEARRQREAAKQAECLRKEAVGSLFRELKAIGWESDSYGNLKKIGIEEGRQVLLAKISTSSTSPYVMGTNQLSEEERRWIDAWAIAQNAIGITVRDVTHPVDRGAYLVGPDENLHEVRGIV